MRDRAISSVAQYFMRVRCKEFDPYEATEKQISKYQKIHEANKDYLDEASDSSQDVQVCSVGQNEMAIMLR
jgi:hypothetical protein